MKAAVLTGPQAIEVKEVPVPVLKPGEIEIKVSACGVCGSDVHMWKAGRGWGGREGDFHMGHEFCGVVTNPGDSQFKAGDRVTFWANLYCGKCDMCQAGQEQLCREVNGTNYIGFVCNGAYAEYYVGKASNAYLLPDAVSDVAACVDGVRPGGKIVMIGNSIDPEIPFAMNRAVLQEMTLIGSVSCTRKEFEETIDLIAGGMIDPEKYVTEVLPLEGLQHALERQIDPNDPMVKFVVKP